MTSGRTPAARPPVAPYGAAARGERWWPVALAIVVAVVLHVALPAKYRVNPPWVVPAVLLALLAALIIGDPGRIDRQKTWLRIVTSTMIAFITVANLLAAVRLVRDNIANRESPCWGAGACRAPSRSGWPALQLPLRWPAPAATARRPQSLPPGRS